MTRRLTILLALLATAAAPPRPDPERIGVIGRPAGSGASPAVAEVRPDLRGYVVYHPAARTAAPLPIVIWGEGGCRDNGLSNSHFLREVASHGYLVVAVGHPRDERAIGPDAAPRPAAPATFTGPPPGQDETNLAQLIHGIDWAVAENDRPGSPFRGRIATDRVAVMGHSCGGLQAIAASADPRVTTTMIWNSGVYIRRTDNTRSGIRITKDALARLHAPIAYVTGGAGDIAHANAADDVARIHHVPVFFAHTPVGHSGTFWKAPNGGAYGRIAVAWLDWRLKGAAGRSTLFEGADCGLCTTPGWTVVRNAGS